MLRLVSAAAALVWRLHWVPGQPPAVCKDLLGTLVSTCSCTGQHWQRPCSWQQAHFVSWAASCAVAAVSSTCASACLAVLLVCDLTCDCVCSTCERVLVLPDVFLALEFLLPLPEGLAVATTRFLPAAAGVSSGGAVSTEPGSGRRGSQGANEDGLPTFVKMLVLAELAAWWAGAAESCSPVISASLLERVWCAAPR